MKGICTQWKKSLKFNFLFKVELWSRAKSFQSFINVVLLARVSIIVVTFTHFASHLISLVKHLDTVSIVGDIYVFYDNHSDAHNCLFHCNLQISWVISRLCQLSKEFITFSQKSQQIIKINFDIIAHENALVSLPFPFHIQHTHSILNLHRNQNDFWLHKLIVFTNKKSFLI